MSADWLGYEVEADLLDKEAARLEAATNSLALAEADLTLARAQRRDIELRLSRTEIKAPVAGIISRRTARLGQMAIGAMGAMSGDPLFRIIAKAEIELPKR